MTIVLFFWLWIPWQAGGPTFHETQLEFLNYAECMGMREHLIIVAQTRYPAGTVADGWCSPKGAFYDLKSNFKNDLQEGREAFENKHGGDH